MSKEELIDLINEAFTLGRFYEYDKLHRAVNPTQHNRLNEIKEYIENGDKKDDLKELRRMADFTNFADHFSQWYDQGQTFKRRI